MQHLEIKNNTKLFSLKSKFRERSLFMAWGGGVGAPKRKGLGKQKFECGQGWVNGKQNNSRVG
jgi:hypothetical protein